MSSFDFKDDPFWWIREEMDQLHGQYSKLESITRGASKLLGDCKSRNIIKEFKKLKQQDTTALEATKATLSSRVAELKVELVLKDEEIYQLKEQQTGSLERIQEVIGNPGNVLNKAHLFDNQVKAEDQLAQKILTILVDFKRKMEITLGEMQKLFSKSQAEGLSQLPLPAVIPQKGKQWEVLRTHLQQRSVKKVIAEVAKIEVPPVEFPATTLAANPITVKTKKIEKDSGTKTTSSEPSSQRRSARKKTKEPFPEQDEDEESSEEEIRSSGEEPELEEAEPTTPPPEKKKEIETQSFDRKKPASAFKILIAPK